MTGLSERFRDLRVEEADSAPLFASLLTPRARTARSTGRLVFATTLLVLLVGLAILLSPDETTLAPHSVAMPVWRAPTDFLLQTPGIELVRSTPQFGDIDATLKGTS